MIIELPASNCVGVGSPFGPGIARARQQFDSRFTATTSMKSTSTAVAVKGVGFWDFLHGQTGVAPNGIEVHPVLDITFPAAAATAPESLEDQLPEVVWPADMIKDDDGGRVHVYRGGDATGDVLFHGGAVVEDPSIHVLFAGAWTDAEQRPVLAAARLLSRDERVRELDRYGVRTFGFRASSQPLSLAAGELNDLDVQRALLREVEAGRIQHVDPDAVYVVMLDATMQPSLGGTSDWLSYHSQFHPTELPLRYVVVRGGLDRATQREAIRASVARALVNPAGDGWY
jgi:ribosomal protein S9